MRCGDCKYYTQTHEEDRFSAPRHRSKEYPNGFPYVKERIKKGQLNEDQVKNETRDAKEHDRNYFNTEDFKFVCTIREGHCSLMFDASRMNNKSNIVTADADDDYGLEINVGENFGCIHFDKKDE